MANHKKSKQQTFWAKTKRKIYAYQQSIKLILLVGAILIFSFLLYKFSPALIKLVKKTILGPKLAYSFLTADTSSLSAHQNRINLLLLGIGGQNSESTDLTDTIIFTSIDKTTADVMMVSIPRDLWIDPLKTKINAVYHYGAEKSPEAGFTLAKDAVYQTLNQPLHYSLLIDFTGFEKLIDLIGGIELKVDRSFVDLRYPIPGKERDECNGDLEFKCRYEQLHFEAGQQTMDGQTALKFVRSRNAEGEEGTDFARSQRQQKVIMVLAAKLFSYKVLLNPAKMLELKNNFGEHIKTDTQFSYEQMTAFLSLFVRFIINKNQIRTLSLDVGSPDGPGFLVNPPLTKYNQWVLEPRTGNFDEIHKYIEEKIYKGY